jgi:hypothetical protein
MHALLVQPRRHFDAMSKLHGVATGVEQYGCIEHTAAKPACKTTHGELARGLIARYYIVEGVKYATLKLRGCCIRKLKVVGVI